MMGMMMELTRACRKKRKNKIGYVHNLLLVWIEFLLLYKIHLFDSADTSSFRARRKRCFLFKFLILLSLLEMPRSVRTGSASLLSSPGLEFVCIAIITRNKFATFVVDTLDYAFFGGYIKIPAGAYSYSACVGSCFLSLGDYSHY